MWESLLTLSGVGRGPWSSFLGDGLPPVENSGGSMAWAEEEDYGGCDLGGLGYLAEGKDR